jgi:hypothetical protein
MEIGGKSKKCLRPVQLEAKLLEKSNRFMSSLIAKAKAKREEKKKASDQEKQNNQDEKDEIEREKQAASFRAHWQWSLYQFDDRMPEEATALGVPGEEFKELMNVINGDLLQAYAKKWQDPGAVQNAVTL